MLLEIKIPSIRQAYQKGYFSALKDLKESKAMDEHENAALKDIVLLNYSVAEQKLADLIEDYQEIKNDSFNGIY